MTDMDEDEEGWARVADAVNARIAERGLSLTRIESESGVSFRSLKKVVTGQGLDRADRLSVLATYLGWRGDAFDRIRQGDEPVPLAGTSDPASSDLRELLGVGGGIIDDQLRELRDRTDRLAAMVEDLAERAGDDPAGEPGS